MKHMGITQQKTLNNGDETMKMAGAAFFSGMKKDLSKDT
jgi:hypothetical protein